MTEPTSPQISVVLPIYNQAPHVERIVRNYVGALGRVPAPAEIVLVTNGCRDESPAIAARLAAESDVIRHFDLREGGWGRAVKKGLAEARGKVLCYTNAARTTPEMLVLLLVYASAYPDVVLKANRRIRDNWRRRLGSVIYNLECRALFDLPMWDVNGTPKVFPRAFEKLTRLRRDDDLIDAEFNAICVQEGYPVVEIPILATDRQGGKSTTNYRSALKMYTGALRLKRELGG